MFNESYSFVQISQPGQLILFLKKKERKKNLDYNIVERLPVLANTEAPWRMEGRFFEATPKEYSKWRCC